MAWIEKLVKAPEENTWGDKYFPRRFHYKQQALALQKEVQDRGGVAVLEKTLKSASL